MQRDDEIPEVDPHDVMSDEQIEELIRIINEASACDHEWVPTVDDPMFRDRCTKCGMSTVSDAFMANLEDDDAST